MKLFIPELGTKIKLTKPWSFLLKGERRNIGLARLNSTKLQEFDEKRKELFREYKRLSKYSKRTDSYYEEFCKARSSYWSHKFRDFPKNQNQTYTFPAGTVLTIDRIYIRAGIADFSSVTFKWVHNKKTIRFWAKLEDVNNINFSLSENKPEYPDGRFTLYFKEYVSTYDSVGNNRCHCTKYPCICNRESWPVYKDYILRWEVNHKAARTNHINSRHIVGTDGRDELTNQHFYANYNKYYKRHFDSFESLIKWAYHKQFTIKIIDDFTAKYKKILLDNPKEI